MSASPNIFAVNDFYPIAPGTSAPIPPGVGFSRPLSTFFSTLAQAAAAFPNLNFTAYGVTLADEVDWCVWQSAMDFLYNRPNPLADFWKVKFPYGALVADGVYMVNRSVNIEASNSIKISGAVPPGSQYSYNGTWIIYNGPSGTIDQNINVFNFVYSGSEVAPVRCLTDGIGFRAMPNGKEVAVLFTDFTQATFINGINLQAGIRCEISRCSFADGIWDGIKATGPQIEPDLHRNLFYGVQRDGISICGINGNNSTTVWIDKNEFGAVGRYAVLCNCEGSVEAKNIMRDNSVESAYAAYATVITPRGAEVPSIGNIPSGLFQNVVLTNTLNGGFACVSMSGSETGIVRAMPHTSFLSKWAANTAYHTSTQPKAGWWSGTPFIIAASENGFIYQCTTAGVSGSTEPAWPTAIGGTIADGDAVWTCVARCFVQAAVGNGREEMWNLGTRTFIGNAIPTVGWYNYGDRVTFRAPSAGGYVGAVCVAAGSPGTWKNYGAIAA